MKRPNPHPLKYLQSSAGYPMSVVYLCGVCLAICVSQHWVQLQVGIGLFTLVAMLSLLVAVMREIKSVRHQLAFQAAVHSAQTVELGDQINVLIAALNLAGVEVPRQQHRTGGDPPPHSQSDQ